LSQGANTPFGTYGTPRNKLSRDARIFLIRNTTIMQPVWLTSILASLAFGDFSRRQERIRHFVASKPNNLDWQIFRVSMQHSASTELTIFIVFAIIFTIMIFGFVVTVWRAPQIADRREARMRSLFPGGEGALELPLSRGMRISAIFSWVLGSAVFLFTSAMILGVPILGLAAGTTPDSISNFLKIQIPAVILELGIGSYMVRRMRQVGQSETPQ
jgi:hypothetical protein